VLAEVGVLLMMLYIGMEIHPNEMFKASWAGLLAAFGGFITPFILGYYTVILFGGEALAGLFVGIAVGVTSRATKSRILVDLKLLGTRVAHVLMAGALFSDTAALVVFAGILSVVDAGSLDFAGISVVAGKAILFFVVTAAVGWFLLPYVTRRMSVAGMTNRTLNATLILMVALFFGTLAELAGLHSILGAFIAGLFLREGMLERRLFDDINKLVHDVSIGFLAPVFFVTAGFEVSFAVFRTDLWLLIAILVVATVGKIAGTVLFYLPSGNGWREGLAVGTGMNGRGAVEIIIAGLGLQMGIIDNTIFSILVFMAIFTTATVPLLLTWTVNWLRRRGELVSAADARDGVLIVGAGPTARAFARQLGEEQPVRLIDTNRENSDAALKEGLDAVWGDANRERDLARAGAEMTQAMIAMTPNPGANVIAAQIAFLVYEIPEIYVMVGASTTGGMSTILADINAQPICAYPVNIRKWDDRVRHDLARVVEIPVAEKAALGSVLEQIGGEEVLPLLIRREGDNRLPCSTLTVRPGDVVMALRSVSTPAERPAS
jgi:Kef-type K+ transport system membrane component KefB